MNTTVLPTPGTGAIQRTLLVSVSAVFLLFAGHTRAAIVGPSGYTNDFATQPAATNFATISTGTSGNDTYDPDEAMNAITAAGVTAQTTANASTGTLATATWSSTGFFLQTRPTGNRATILMGKFANNTGTNVTEIALSYLYTITAAGNTMVGAEDIGKGTRVYYSLSGLAGSWVNIPGLSSTSSTPASTFISANVTLNWTNGGNLYVAWFDDNGAPATDYANQYDNFSLYVTAGTPPITDLTLLLNTPANGATYVSGTSLIASSLVLNGTAPFTVQYFTNSGAGNTIFASAGSITAAPYNLSLGTPPVGTYNIYAVVTDSAGSPGSTNSVTNSFVVADPITFALTAPANDSTFENTVGVTGTATVSGGTAPHSVQFYLDHVAVGTPLTSAPFEHNFGTLVVGDHTIHAVVTDARGWVSNSSISTIHISGALAATLIPTNGAAFNYGHSLVLTAAIAGGTAPYVASFYVNEQLTGTVSAAPFTNHLGILAVGSYTSYVHATDSSVPAEQSDSSINIFTIVPNPLVATLTSPTNGRTATAGQPFALGATATVNAPLTVTNVQFFADGVSAGVDAASPFTGSIASPTSGAHSVYVIARDSLGRTSISATNTVTFVVDPLANNNFANRFTLNTPDSVTAANAGATVEGNFQNGEPQFGQNPGGGFFLWGATLWWKWIAPFSGTVTIDTFGSTFDTFLGVYTGTAVNALAAVAQNNDAPGLINVSRVSFTATAGTEYQVQVGGITAGFGGPAAVGNILLHLSMPPFVAITDPIAGSTYLVGSNIAVSATAGATAAAVTNVSLYRGSTFLGSADNPPYSFVVSNAPAGSNAFYAVATDAIGQVGTSAVVRVLVANVGVTITSPVEDQIFQGASP
ncbi:MAG TPA: Ig-like domain-containing protein, partial [Candidatus Limnocylindria bacterium]|nr:Ig-like domain-containing protein [Candidatus Limnocylindria bacterium]